MREHLRIATRASGRAGRTPPDRPPRATARGTRMACAQTRGVAHVRACRSCSLARFDHHVDELAGLHASAHRRCSTVPSISGASAAERATAPSAPASSTSTCDGAADFALQFRRGDFRLHRHEMFEAVFLQFFRHRVRQLVGLRAVHRRIGERADAIQLGLAQEVQQFLELGIGLAGKADDEGAADGQVRHDRLRQLWMRSSVLSILRRALHQFQDARAGVLERDVEVRQDFSFRHQRDHLVHVRIRVDVVQARPHAQLGQALGTSSVMRVRYDLPRHSRSAYFRSTP